MTVVDTAEKWLPSHIHARLLPLVDRMDAILRQRDRHAQAQRMALSAFAIRVVSAGIAFGSQIVLARLMGSFEYGIFVFVWALAVIFGNLSCFGFHTAIIRFLPGYQDEKANAEIRGLTQTARRFAVASASFVVLVGMIGVQLFGDAISDYYLVPLYLGMITLPMIALGDVLDGTARANNWPLFGLGATFLLRPTLILVFMVIAAASGMERTAETALEAAILATYLTTIAQYWAVTLRVKRRFATPLKTITFRRWFLVALPIFFIEGFYFLLTNSDVIVVGFFVPPEQVAVYFASAKTMALVHFVYFAVRAGAQPRFSQLVTEGDRASLADFARQTIRWTFWPSLFVGSLVLLAGPFLLSLFGPGFAEGEALMAILFAGIMAKSLIGPGEVLLTMTGHQTICAFVYLCVLITNVALNIALIPSFGLFGAATATALSMGLEAILLFTVVRWRLKFAMVLFAPRPATAGSSR
ncbi:lipopolysaccharide biosynthesis protein [Pararhizobium haloflavum]|uniref:lipopolysaccharide biosynthesis protein n=1 Tax=Pararhizobium haloflavum TaxID=2037914 RepID=UPI000C175CA8|nr:lipopolysaccharide biosynthesis protein [Pararhizobium haloflavum]